MNGFSIEHLGWGSLFMLSGVLALANLRRLSHWQQSSTRRPPRGYTEHQKALYSSPWMQTLNRVGFVVWLVMVSLASVIFGIHILLGNN